MAHYSFEITLLFLARFSAKISWVSMPACQDNTKIKNFSGFGCRSNTVDQKQMVISVYEGKKKIIVLSPLKYKFLPLLHITARKLREKSFWLLWLCDMRQHFLSDIIGNYLVKKIVRFFLIPAPFHCTHISWLIKRKVFAALLTTRRYRLFALPNYSD